MTGRRIVLRISKLAKIALLVTIVGMVLVIYGRQTGKSWPVIPGNIAVFGGAAVYLIERFRGRGRRRD
ncbi:MAG: hypothetical protein ACYTGZ_15735 [Planctomycetota bacterium]|jgi:drug/metabolite transporter (DMT)-like permease